MFTYNLATNPCRSSCLQNVLSAMPHFELFDRHDAVLYRTLCGRKYI